MGDLTSQGDSNHLARPLLSARPDREGETHVTPRRAGGGLVSASANDALTIVPIQPSPGLDWPCDGEFTGVPTARRLAAHGRRSCPDGFFRLLARNRRQAV